MLAQLRHGFGEPEAGSDQQQHDHEGGDVDLHAVTIIVGVAAALELGKIGDRRGRVQRRCSAPAREQHHARLRVGGSVVRHFRYYSTSHASVRRLPAPRILNWTPLTSGSRLAAMSKSLPARRAVALIAAYVVALQALLLLLPLSVAAGGSAQMSLCSESSNGAPVKHDTGCPCAAGCGMQCHAPALDLLGPGAAARLPAPQRALAALLAPLPPAHAPVPADRGPQMPRGPPAA